MTCKSIIEKLNILCPENMAESWDNPGLLCGHMETDVHKVYIALDATSEVIDACVANGVDMLITHHPLIFSGIKKVNGEDMIGRRLLKLIENHICYYAMHTNFDVCVMGDLAANMLNLSDCQVLDVTETRIEGGAEKVYGIGTVGNLPETMTLETLAKLVKDTFSIPDVRIFGNKDMNVEKVAMCPGSGKSLMGAVLKSGAQVYITGDMGHHDGIDANEDGIAVIDAGHQGIEHIFIDFMKYYVEHQIGSLEVFVENTQAPFVTL